MYLLVNEKENIVSNVQYETYAAAKKAIIEGELLDDWQVVDIDELVEKIKEQNEG